MCAPVTPAGWRDMCLPFVAGVDRARWARSLFTGGRPSVRAWTRSHAVGSDGGDLAEGSYTKDEGPCSGSSPVCSSVRPSADKADSPPL